MFLGCGVGQDKSSCYFLFHLLYIAMTFLFFYFFASSIWTNIPFFISFVLKYTFFICFEIYLFHLIFCLDFWKYQKCTTGNPICKQNWLSEPGPGVWIWSEPTNACISNFPLLLTTLYINSQHNFRTLCSLKRKGEYRCNIWVLSVYSLFPSGFLVDWRANLPQAMSKCLCACSLVNIGTHVLAADYGFVVTPFSVPRLFWQQSSACLDANCFRSISSYCTFENILFCRQKHVTTFICRLWETLPSWVLHILWLLKPKWGCLAKMGSCTGMQYEFWRGKNVVFFSFL